MKRTLITMLAVVLAVAIVVPAVAATSSGTTAVVGHMNHRVAVSSTDSGILVKANMAWTVVVQTSDGSARYAGGNTSGTAIDLPADTVAYWVVTE